MRVTIYKDRNVLRTWARGKLEKTLCSLLTYEHKKFLMTEEERRAAGGQKVLITLVQCYDLATVDGDTVFVTNAGYLQRLTAGLQAAGYEVTVEDKGLGRDPGTFEPHWPNVADFDWKHRQRETLEALLENERGQVWFATGAGKSWLMIPLCSVLPKARIAICTKHIAVLQEHYERLRRHIPSVGLVTGSKKEFGRRITCVSAGCLGYLDPKDVDILIADEHHELATPAMLEKLGQFTSSRLFGLSANFGDRADGADFELEGVFGPLIAELSYQEGVQNDMIVPIEVHWRDVNLARDPAAWTNTSIALKRHGLWRNKVRNALIAEDARRFPEAQVLITVETLEHACYLKKHLPEFELCYSAGGATGKQLDKFKDLGLLPHDEPPMTRDRLRELKKVFESGELRKVIATSVWNRGVNFHQLEVLIRADGGASAITDTQIPGRLARMSDGKECGILIDYLDQFNRSLEGKARRRKKDYKQKGWKQIYPQQEVAGAFYDSSAATQRGLAS